MDVLVRQDSVVAIKSQVVHNDHLSFTAVGLYAYLTSLPEGQWDLSNLEERGVTEEVLQEMKNNGLLEVWEYEDGSYYTLGGDW